MLRAVNEVKAELSTRREIPKPKKLAPVMEEALPEGFHDPNRFAPLGQLARIEKGLTGIKQARPGPFPLVVTGAQRSSCDHFDFEGAATIIPLVSSTGHGHASLNRLHYQEGKFALGTILAAVFPYDPTLLSARFLFEYLFTFKEELLVTRMTGTANVTLTVGRIAEVPVPLIDPGVQKRVDELMTVCDRLEAARMEREATRDRMATASLARLNTPDPDPSTFQNHAAFALNNLTPLTTRPDQIKALRQTILNLAVRGKLVPQDLSEGTSSSLVLQLEQARAVGMPSRQLKKTQKLETPGLSHMSFQVPRNWALVKLGLALELINGRAFKPSDWTQTGLPIVRIQNLNNPGASFNFYDGEVKDKFLINTGDFLISWSGTPGTSFGAHIWEGGPAVLNQHIFKAVLIGNVFEPHFLKLAINARLLELIEQAHGGVGLQHITKPKLEAVSLTLPPLAEQHRIVIKVDELMTLCDRLETSLEMGNETRRRLIESVLHEALEPNGTPKN